MRSSPVVRSLVPVALLAVLASSALATPPLGRHAKEAGFEDAKDCIYCHTIHADHQWAKARSMGITPMNCVACHGSNLPIVKFYNERGRWLIAEKERRKAKDADAAWLKDYVEPKPSPKAK